MLSIGLPIGCEVKHAVGPQTICQQSDQARLDQASLVVTFFMPGIREVDVHSVYGSGLQNALKYLDSIFRVHPDIAQVLREYPGQQFTDPRAMHFHANKLAFRLRMGHGEKAVSHAKSDLDYAVAGAAKRRVPINGS